MDFVIRSNELEIIPTEEAEKALFNIWFKIGVDKTRFMTNIFFDSLIMSITFKDKDEKEEESE